MQARNATMQLKKYTNYFLPAWTKNQKSRFLFRFSADKEPIGFVISKVFAGAFAF
jgi:hypothetical protein